MISVQQIMDQTVNYVFLNKVEPTVQQCLRQLQRFSNPSVSLLLTDVELLHFMRLEVFLS